MIRMPASRAAVLFLSALHLTVWPHAAQAADAKEHSTAAQRTNTPSGLPVPRFVSLKADKTNCRTGPSFEHPVRMTFMRKGLPVQVVAETQDHWRKVKDAEGDQCWIHRSKLSSAKTAIVTTDGLALRLRPSEDAPLRARLGRGVVAKVEATEGQWARISANKLRGWARVGGVWGALGAP
ncbi:MAG: SH3 domain-containing protein [Hyphococcus sp.]